MRGATSLLYGLDGFRVAHVSVDTTDPAATGT